MFCFHIFLNIARGKFKDYFKKCRNQNTSSQCGTSGTWHLRCVLLYVFPLMELFSQLFHRCQRAVQVLQSRSRSCTEQEARVLRNVVSSLAQSLQDLSTNFRHAQSDYLKRKHKGWNSNAWASAVESTHWAVLLVLVGKTEAQKG